MKSCYVLLIGRKCSGKTTLAAHLVDETLCRLDDARLDRNRNRSTSPLVLFHASPHFTVIDSCGLIDPSICQQSYEDQIQQIVQCCLQYNVKHLNFVGFVSEAGRTNRHDLEMFKAAVRVIGARMLQQGAFILSGAEDYSTERLEQIKRDLQGEFIGFPSSLTSSIFPMGMIDPVRLLETMPNVDERQRVEESKHRRLNEMRQQLYFKILEFSDKPFPIKSFDWLDYGVKKVVPLSSVLALVLAVMKCRSKYQKCLQLALNCVPLDYCFCIWQFGHAWRYITWWLG